MSAIERCQSVLYQLTHAIEQIKTLRGQQPQGKQLKPKQKQKGISQKDKKLILKLFNYDHWENYMKWVDEKLEESGQDVELLNGTGGRNSDGQEQGINGEDEQQNRYNGSHKKGKSTMKSDEGRVNGEQEKLVSVNETEILLLQKERLKLMQHNSALRKKLEDFKQRLERSRTTS